MNYAQALLILLNIYFPLRCADARHNITIEQNGRMCISLWLPEYQQFQKLILDDADLLLSPEELVKKIVKLFPNCRVSETVSTVSRMLATHQINGFCPACQASMKVEVKLRIENGVMLMCTRCGHLTPCFEEEKKPEAECTDRQCLGDCGLAKVAKRAYGAEPYQFFGTRNIPRTAADIALAYAEFAHETQKLQPNKS